MPNCTSLSQSKTNYILFEIPKHEVMKCMKSLKTSYGCVTNQEENERKCMNHYKIVFQSQRLME